MPVISGISAIIQNGTAFDCAQSISYTPMTQKPTILPNWSNKNLVRIEPVPAEVKAKIYCDDSFTVGAMFNGVTGVNVTIIKSTGAQVILSDAVCEIGEVDVVDNSFEVTWMSYNVTELTK